MVGTARMLTRRIRSSCRLWRVARASVSRDVVEAVRFDVESSVNGLGGSRLCEDPQAEALGFSGDGAEVFRRKPVQRVERNASRRQPGEPARASVLHRRDPCTRQTGGRSYWARLQWRPGPPIWRRGEGKQSSIASFLSAGPSTRSKRCARAVVTPERSVWRAVMGKTFCWAVERNSGGHSPPVSKKCAWPSIKPGMSVSPSASMTADCEGRFDFPDCAIEMIFPFWTTTSPFSRGPDEVSTVALVMTSGGIEHG